MIAAKPRGRPPSLVLWRGLTSVTYNNHRRVFEVITAKGPFAYPFAKAEPCPTSDDPIVEIYIDKELGCEGFVYKLASGAEGTLLLDQFFDYNREPEYMRDLLLYRLTLEANRRLAASPLSRREIIRRLDTSPAQFNRLLDTTNYTKSIDGMLMLLQALDCEVEFVVKP